MKHTSSLAGTALLALAVAAGCAHNRTQPVEEGVPLAPQGGAATPGSATAIGTVQKYVYGQQGSVVGFELSDGTVAVVPPDIGQRVHGLAPEGTQLQVTGEPRHDTNGKSVIIVESITVNGETMAVPPSSTTAPPAGTGTMMPGAPPGPAGSQPLPAPTQTPPRTPSPGANPSPGMSPMPGMSPAPGTSPSPGVSPAPGASPTPGGG